MGNVDGGALRTGLLGASSGASFMRQIKKVADGNGTAEQGAKRSRSKHYSPKLLRLSRKGDDEKDTGDFQFVLPPRKTADHLFNVYWGFSDVIFPFLDKQEITRQYQSLWKAKGDFDGDEKVFHCVLNLTFALAAKLDPGSKPETQTKLADLYYGRANKLLSFSLLDISHFDILQALLLAAQYLQSTNMPRQCFQSVGMAIWIAQDLGLHVPETTTALKDFREQELARRVWHGCILMDRY